MSLKRWLGFQEGMLERGLELRADYVIHDETTFEGGLNTVAALLSKPDPPTAILAGSDSVAAGVISGCHYRGVRVPEDISIVGYNDEPIASQIVPALTTVAIPTADMGRAAAQLLSEPIQGTLDPFS